MFSHNYVSYPSDEIAMTENYFSTPDYFPQQELNLNEDNFSSLISDGYSTQYSSPFEQSFEDPSLPMVDWLTQHHMIITTLNTELTYKFTPSVGLAQSRLDDHRQGSVEKSIREIDFQMRRLGASVYEEYCKERELAKGTQSNKRKISDTEGSSSKKMLIEFARRESTTVDEQMHSETSSNQSFSDSSPYDLATPVANSESNNNANRTTFLSPGSPNWSPSLYAYLDDMAKELGVENDGSDKEKRFSSRSH